jgi:methyl-accepting chemotaxis protein
MNNETVWLIVFVALTAFALLVQAIMVVAAFFIVRKTMKTVESHVSELRTTAMPLLNKTKDTLDKVRPKIESIADDVADLTSRAREQSVQVQATASDILERVHRQTSRVDTILTNAMDGVEHASNVVSGSVVKPARKVSAFLAAAKAFLTVMRTGRRPGQQPEVVADQDMFV